MGGQGDGPPFQRTDQAHNGQSTGLFVTHCCAVYMQFWTNVRSLPIMLLPFLRLRGELLLLFASVARPGRVIARPAHYVENERGKASRSLIMPSEC